jgi:hypothetical protein
MPLILGANSVTGGYEVDNSLRFNSGSTEYLQRTPGSAGSLTTWTYSFWTKRSVLATAEQYLSAGPRGGGGNVEDQLYSISTDQINWYDGTAASNVLRTTQLFRDVSAWYHIMFVWDTTNATAGDRARIYVNGAEVTAFSVDNNPSLNAVSKINGTGQHRIGQVGTLPGENLDGYLAEVNFIDGQALDPDNFGEFDADTGIWKPIAYEGTYGTNGFLLEFKDSSALGDDTSGQGNDFTVNNLTSIDQTTDTPTNNFCTWNPLDIANPSYVNTLTEGNLKAGNSTGDALGYYFTTFANFSPSKGKWYWEIKVDLSPTTLFAGIYFGQNTFTTAYPYDAYTFSIPQNGLVYHNGATYTYGASFTTNDILTLALDMDSGKLYVGINGSWANGSGSTNQTFANAVSVTTVSAPFPTGRDVFPIAVAKNAFALVNFGNPPFAITTGNEDANGYGNFEYEVPPGYYALCTKNLAEYG